MEEEKQKIKFPHTLGLGPTHAPLSPRGVCTGYRYFLVSSIKSSSVLVFLILVHFHRSCFSIVCESTVQLGILSQQALKQFNPKEKNHWLVVIFLHGFPLDRKKQNYLSHNTTNQFLL